MKKILFAVAISAILTACGKPAPEASNQIDMETALATAKSNAEFNAQMYKAANPRFTADFSIISRADTSQKPSCPQGDGWAELSIMKVEGKVVDKTVVMCSTYSASIGCFRKEDFDKDKNLAGQDGVCNATVPYPLPVLAKK